MAEKAEVEILADSAATLMRKGVPFREAIFQAIKGRSIREGYSDWWWAVKGEFARRKKARSAKGKRRNSPATKKSHPPHVERVDWMDKQRERGRDNY